MTLVKLTFSLATVSAVIPASRRSARAAAGRPRRPRAEHGAERVGARVAEHGPLAEVLGQQRERGAERRGDGREPAPPGAGAGAAGDARCLRRSAPRKRPTTLIARPGRRSKRLSRFAPPAMRPALIATSAGPPPASSAAPRPVAADAAELDRRRWSPRRARARRGGREGRDAYRSRAGRRDAEGQRAGTGEGEARGTGEAPPVVLDKELNSHGAESNRGALEQRHRLAAVVGAGPRLLPAGRAASSAPRTRRARRRARRPGLRRQGARLCTVSLPGLSRRLRRRSSRVAVAVAVEARGRQRRRAHRGRTRNTVAVRLPARQLIGRVPR